jgi:hypothetical protein
MDNLIAVAKDPDPGFVAMLNWQQFVELCSHINCLANVGFVEKKSLRRGFLTTLSALARR